MNRQHTSSNPRFQSIHAVAITAMPIDRHGSALWHVCVLFAFSLSACVWEGRSGIDAAAFALFAFSQDGAVSEDASALVVGACDNAADSLVVSSAHFDNTVSSCGAQCYGSADVASCASPCIVDASGISAACADCYAYDTACTIAACLTVCMDASSPACQSCRAANCSAAFERCRNGQSDLDAGSATDLASIDSAYVDAFGCRDIATHDSTSTGDVVITSDVVIASGACINSSDGIILNDDNVDINASVDNCSRQCFGQADVATCTSQCLSAATTLSEACSTCFGADTACTIASCLSPCMVPDSATCQECRSQNCVDAFQSCAFGSVNDAGINSDTFGTDAIDEDAPITSEACLTSNDQFVLNSPAIDVEAASRNCKTRCLLADPVSTCVANCMVETTGFTSPCAQCFGERDACALDLCFNPCILPNSQNCQDCLGENCLDAFAFCSGI